MKRELKFRAFNSSMVISDSYISLYYFFDGCENAKHLMQFTGLKDRTGVDIFEGDIVRLGSGRITEILFKDGGFGYYSNQDINVFIGLSGHNWFKEVMSEIEVIGNIYENPELPYQLKYN